MAVAPGFGAGPAAMRVELARRGRGYWPPGLVLVTDIQDRPGSAPARRAAVQLSTLMSSRLSRAGNGCILLWRRRVHLRTVRSTFAPSGVAGLWRDLRTCR